MEDQSNLTAVAIAGLGIGGTLFAQWLALRGGRAERQLKHNQLLLGKLEQLSAAVAASIEWWALRILPADSLAALHAANPPVALRPLKTIPGLYFPDLIEPARAYYTHLHESYVAVLQHYRTCPEGSVSSQLLAESGRNPELNNRLYGNREELRTRLDEAISRQALKFTRCR